MKLNSKRDEFSRKTHEALAKRSGFLCSICKTLTVGPSLESVVSITNIGVAAHITAASPGGRRYDHSITTSARSSISNGIWLCRNHAEMIDRDSKTWTVSKLNGVKNEHEEFVSKNLGIPNNAQAQLIKYFDSHHSQQITPIEYGYLGVKALIEPYKRFITPILQDRRLNDDSIMGVLMCGSPLEEDTKRNRQSLWTLFVNNDWFRWFLTGHGLCFKTAQEIPSEQIYGQIPGWPNNFFEFLEAIVQTNTTFEWIRHKNGYLTLVQQV